jgi:hypothetical protein
MNKPWLFQKGHTGYWLRKTFSLDHRRKLSKSLEKHPLWKGGIVIHNGYRMIKMPSHPYCRKSGYIMEHRIIMEKKIGRYLMPNEKVHHNDENKSNNDPSNLKLNTTNVIHLRRFHLKNKRRDIKYQKVSFYFKKGLSQRKIGKIFNCSHNVIKRILMEGRDD